MQRFAAIVSIVMPSYQRAAAADQGRDRRDRRRRGRRALDGARLDRRPRARRVGGGPHPRRRPRPARQSRVAHRGRRARPHGAGRPLLRLRRALRVRREDTRGARLRGRLLARRRLHRLEAQRLRDHDAADALAGEAHPLLAPPADPGDRRGGPAQAARLAHPADRRRRPRLARRRSTSPRPASARSGSSTPTSSTSRTCSARSRTRSTRSARRRSTRAKRTIEALNPDVEVVDLPRAAHLREHRSDPRRRLGPDRRRRRQLPDALPRERRVGLARHPGRARLDLPLRGPGHRLQAARRPVLPLPLPAAAAARARAVVRRGRRAGRAAGHHRLAADERGDQARGSGSATR